MHRTIIAAEHLTFTPAVWSISPPVSTTALNRAGADAAARMELPIILDLRA